MFLHGSDGAAMLLGLRPPAKWRPAPPAV